MLKDFINFFIFYLVKFLLSLRYRFTVTGLDALNLDKSCGVLLLSNHVAEIDPVIIEFLLWRKLKPHPLASSSLFKSSFVRWVLGQVGAVAVPDVSFAEKDRIRKKNEISKYFSTVLKILKNSETVLLYPSGKISREGPEVLGGSSSAYVLLQEIDKCNVVLVRIRGLWGSSFSRYNRNSTPPLGATFKKSFFALLRKGFFFLPRRPVSLTLERVDFSLLRSFAGKQELNRFLEAWFNRDPERVCLVPY
ncbi:lysophospholipid acyltransferase family protein [Chlamydiifrater phoenicopteri]|uniref:lysophospholipid acyltransferase family protein n=1 Tax=Chlamydiifrater phoenicopteri TaxID=2681469 RepID=UPI001BCE562D|nr:lysophospholipid acyltransferase family protein [Chlamydiifrater phoenicopteri]